MSEPIGMETMSATPTGRVDLGMHGSLRADSLLYHATGVDNVSEIMAEGIIPSDRRNHLENLITHVAAEHGIRYPIDRSECVFLSPLFSQATGLRTFDEEELNQRLRSREAVIIVDAEQIEQDLYLGDDMLFGEALALSYKTDDDSHEDVLRQYAESLTRVRSLGNLSELCCQFHRPEIVIEGGVNPEAIVGCVLDNRYFTRLF